MGPAHHCTQLIQQLLVRTFDTAHLSCAACMLIDLTSQMTSSIRAAMAGSINAFRISLFRECSTPIERVIGESSTDLPNNFNQCRTPTVVDWPGGQS
jgi:hypothetical protein